MSDIDIKEDPDMTLLEWQDLIARLIEEHGGEAVMFADGGYNNVDLKIEK